MTNRRNGILYAGVSSHQRFVISMEASPNAPSIPVIPGTHIKRLHSIWATLPASKEVV
jgi:hypothetical protein